MKQTLTTLICAKYMPCGIMVNGEPRKLVGVNWAECALHLSEWPDENNEGEPDWRYFNEFEELPNCQLILHKLEDARDEDALYVSVQIFGDKAPDRVKDVLYACRTGQFMTKICHTWLPYKDMVSIVDFLRAKSYDLDGLIGTVAVDAKTIKPQVAG